MRSDHQCLGWGSGLGGLVCAVVGLACIALPAGAQIYSFTSGPSGDGFNWPASPTGLLESDDFSTPDDIIFINFTGNSVFFDSQYQVAGNGSRINGDALWGNPVDTHGDPTMTLDFYDVGGVQDVAFDFAWSAAGIGEIGDIVTFAVYDSENRSTFYDWTLGSTFSGFGGSTGYEDRISLSTSFLIEDEGDGDPLANIEYVDIYLNEIVTGGPSSEFAIDDFVLGDGGVIDNLYPSVNQGQHNITGTAVVSSTLRGTGTHSANSEVTNDASTSTTYSTELVPGGDLTVGTLPSGAFINAGQSIYSPNIATLDRSLPSGEYESDIRIVNDGDPIDPDNLSTLRIKLFDPQSLSGNFASVDVLSSEQITLSNAAAAVNGFRASVEVTGSQTMGPFQVTGFAIDTAVKPGETAQTSVTFNRYGALTGNRAGTHTVSLQQTSFSGTNNSQEVFLFNTEPVPDQVWNLSYNLLNTSSDNANVSTGFSYFQALGVNTFDVAATLLDGTSSTNQNVSMQITSDPDPASADLVGEPVDLDFSNGAGDQYVLQLTYNDGALPSGVTESQLQLLVFDTASGDWEVAVDGNTTGGSTFFNGSYEDYLAGLGGGVFDAADLGFFGLDTVNNHVWAVLDHASTFGVGVLTAGGSGDFDGDGDVDGADFLTWQRAPNTWSLSDWQSAYGNAVATDAAAAVPEPTTFTFLVVCLLMTSIASSRTGVTAPARSNRQERPLRQ